MSLSLLQTTHITNWREKYKSLQEEREMQMTKKIIAEVSLTRKSVLRLSHRPLNRSLSKALKLRKGMSLGLLKQRALFAKKIFSMLNGPGLGVPFFFGIRLSGKMRMLIRKIISHKNMMWMILLKEQWRNNEIAKAERGEQVRAEFGWLKINTLYDRNIYKMKVVAQDGKDHVASQHNDYWREKLGVMKQDIIDGKYHTRNAQGSSTQ